MKHPLSKESGFGLGPEVLLERVIYVVAALPC